MREEEEEEKQPNKFNIHSRPTPRATRGTLFPQADFRRGGTWQKKWWHSLDLQKGRWKVVDVTTSPRNRLPGRHSHGGS